jgi:hypothetical protein
VFSVEPKVFPAIAVHHLLVRAAGRQSIFGGEEILA